MEIPSNMLKDSSAQGLDDPSIKWIFEWYLRRNSEDIEIVCYTAGKDISYSGCGIPYYIEEDYITRKNLTPRDVKWFKDRFNIDIHISHRVEKVDVETKKILIKKRRKMFFLWKTLVCNAFPTLSLVQVLIKLALKVGLN